MSYHVLARKWRPKTFQAMVGQEYVIKTLTNALEKKRLHHAYLFTGTRGVGKTTAARVMAKCLNCEQGITATPCGECSACQEIDAGRFIDLIEVDAASRTKVEDTRELLDNVQYVPSRGRFKIYLIDEVHMLSGHSFNALLKTLEEPPEHVKFLLATTDPQKLPATVLSRCLQFHLRALSSEHIASELEHILREEQIPFELAALEYLAQAANGSMRDALSLLDQSIAYTSGTLTTEEVRKLLGTVEKKHIEQILQTLASRDASQLLAISQNLAEQSACFSLILDDLLAALHDIAIIQSIPNALPASLQSDTLLKNLSAQLSPEDVQLYYNISLLGKRDLELSQHQKNAFDMILLRMLAFQPFKKPKTNSGVLPQPQIVKKPAPNELPISKQNQSESTLFNPDSWEKILAAIPLTGMTLALATNCIIHSWNNTNIVLYLSAKHLALLNEKSKIRLQEALINYFKKSIKLAIEIEEPETDTPAAKIKKQADEKHKNAMLTLENDPVVQSLIEHFETTIDPSLVQTTSN